jgi:hypothetical protein
MASKQLVLAPGPESMEHATNIAGVVGADGEVMLGFLGAESWE